jgi:hypothetical protein
VLHPPSSAHSIDAAAHIGLLGGACFERSASTAVHERSRSVGQRQCRSDIPWCGAAWRVTDSKLAVSCSV